MSPHALPLVETGVDSHSGNSPAVNDAQAGGEGPGSLLQRYPDDEVHDLVCIGFGPASLAIAVALHDALELKDPRIGNRAPKVRFLEKQERFAWHAGMLLPGTKMQITFVKDMATLRNPRSHFTFVNYLHQHDRLVTFTNLGTFLPQRIEYEDYMRWCANHFGAVVDYGRDVQKVDVGKTNPTTGAIETFQVSAVDPRTGHVSRLRTKHVVIAAGGRPNIPKPLPTNHPRVIHSSQYATHIDSIFPAGSRPRRIVVIGGGQSAAEVFENVPSRFPGTQSVLVIRGAALKPSDDSPFVNEVFNPERIDHIFAQEPSLRAAGIAHDKATNYGVVRLELLEHIYNEMYSYRVKRLPEEAWPHRIFNHRRVLGVRDGADDCIELDLANDTARFAAATTSSGTPLPDRETVEADLIVVATGYRRDAYEEMLSDLRDVQAVPASSTAPPRAASPSSSVSSPASGASTPPTVAENSPHALPELPWAVDRKYAVQFAPGAVAEDAGIYLQGCNERTHGLADSLLSVLAVRGGEVVESIFGQQTKEV